MASLLRDRGLLEEARGEAQGLLRDARKVGSPSGRWLMDAARARFSEKIAWMDRA